MVLVGPNGVSRLALRVRLVNAEYFVQILGEPPGMCRKNIFCMQRPFSFVQQNTPSYVSTVTKIKFQAISSLFFYGPLEVNAFILLKTTGLSLKI